MATDVDGPGSGKSRGVRGDGSGRLSELTAVLAAEVGNASLLTSWLTAAELVGAEHEQKVRASFTSSLQITIRSILLFDTVVKTDILLCCWLSGASGMFLPAKGRDVRSYDFTFALYEIRAVSALRI